MPLSNSNPFPDIQEIISAKDWKSLVKKSLPVNVADLYTFSEAMHIADFLIEASVEILMEDGFTADLMRDYSVNLMKILRAKYPHEWKEDWKNEAYLGLTCGIVFREEEAFEHVEKAYKQLEDPPQSLILAYIRAGSGPDHFLTEEEVAQLSQKAVDKGITYETSSRMATLAYERRELEKEKYWKNKAIEAEKNGIHTPIIIPNVLKAGSAKEEGVRYEE